MSKYVWKDMGWQDLKSRLSRLTGLQVSAGIVGSEAEHLHGNSELTNAEIGALMEFGSDDGHIPARSFMGSTVRESRTAYMNVAKKALRQFIEFGANPNDVLNEIGRWIVDRMKEKVLSNVGPELADATIEKKGHDHALIDTDKLFDCITYEIVHTAITEVFGPEGKFAGNFEAADAISASMRGE